MSGTMLQSLSDDINSLNQQGLVSVSEIDYYQSYINDIRVIDNTHLEVDTCEVWNTNTYRQANSQPVSSDGPRLLPQTISIEQSNGSWFITNVNFLVAPAFCS